jgi:hypothetical protein
MKDREARAARDDTPMTKIWSCCSLHNHARQSRAPDELLRAGNGIRKILKLLQDQSVNTVTVTVANPLGKQADVINFP